MNKPTMERLPVEAPPGCRDHVLPAETTSDHPLDSCRVRCVSATPAANGWDRPIRGESALCRYVASSHLQHHLSHRGSVSAVSALQHDVAQSEVRATQPGSFARVQEGANALPHGRADARRSLIVSKFSHNVLGCVLSFFEPVCKMLGT